MVAKRKRWLIGVGVALTIILLGLWIIIWPDYKRALEDAEKYGDEPYRYEMPTRQRPEDHEPTHSSDAHE